MYKFDQKISAELPTGERSRDLGELVKRNQHSSVLSAPLGLDRRLSSVVLDRREAEVSRNTLTKKGCNMATDVKRTQADPKVVPYNSRPYKKISVSHQCRVSMRWWNSWIPHEACFQTSLFPWCLVHYKQQPEFQFQKSGARKYSQKYTSLHECKCYGIGWNVLWP